MSLANAQQKLEDSHKYYNEEWAMEQSGKSPPNNAAELRWRNQPAIVTEPENFSLRRSKVRPQRTSAEALIAAG